MWVKVCHTVGMTYFHGTNVDLPIGEILVPGVELGESRNHGRSEHVYMTWDGFSDNPDVGYGTAVREAFAWALTACMVAEDEGDDETQQAYVYIVEPLGEVEPDEACDEQVGEESVRTSSARIVGVMDPYELQLHLPYPFYGEDYLNL